MYTIYYTLYTFFLFFFFHLTYSRWASLPSCLWSQRIFPSLRFTPYNVLSRCKFSTLTTRQLMVAFYLLTFPRFPLRKKEHKPYFGKNRTHDIRTSRCAGYLLDHSGDEQLYTIYYMLYTIYYTLYTMYYTYYILYTIYYILYTTCCILYTIYYILYKIYYILHCRCCC